MPVHHEVGIRQQDLVAGIQQRQERQDDAARHPRREHARLGTVPALAFHLIEDPRVERRKTTRHGVAVVPFAHGAARGLDERLRRLEMRLTDGEVDRILHRRHELEDPPDAARLEAAHPLS